MRYFFLSIFFLLKHYFIKLFFKQKKIYTIEDLPSLHGIELQYLSNILCMKVYIATSNKKGIILMGCWYNEHDKQYEDVDSIIYCINNITHSTNEKEFLNKINEAIHTGVWFNTNNTNSYKVEEFYAFQ